MSQMTLLNGNQTMILMTALNTDKINGNQFVGSTIVSTPMMMELATLRRKVV
jgi:hypothetical protein